MPKGKGAIALGVHYATTPHECITWLRLDGPSGYRIAREGGVPERLRVTPTQEIGDGSAVVEAAIAGLWIAQMPWSLVTRPWKTEDWSRGWPTIL